MATPKDRDVQIMGTVIDSAENAGVDVITAADGKDVPGLNPKWYDDSEKATRQVDDNTRAAEAMSGWVLFG